jgi:hypothetical protein
MEVPSPSLAINEVSSMIQKMNNKGQNIRSLNHMRVKDI